MDHHLARRRGDCRHPPRGAKRLVQRYYNDVLMDRRLELLEELLADDFLSHDSAGATIDRVGYADAVAMLHAAFTDLDVMIDDQVAERDRVTTRWSAVGTHTGSFAGIGPTGREVTISGIDIHRVHRGRLAENWEQLDLARLVAQLI
jgi:steroid delta-isomerase-like uncharacterized protein